MPNEILITPNAIAWARLTKSDRTIRLTLSLGREFTGGKLVHMADGATFSLQGADELASQYTTGNWMSGLISGSLYAFRTLEIPRQEVRIHECSGRLNSSDMEALAYASAMAVSKLANHDMAGPEGWAWAVGIQSESPPRVSA